MTRIRRRRSGIFGPNLAVLIYTRLRGPRVSISYSSVASPDMRHNTIYLYLYYTCIHACFTPAIQDCFQSRLSMPEEYVKNLGPLSFIFYASILLSPSLLFYTQVEIRTRLSDKNLEFSVIFMRLFYDDCFYVFFFHDTNRAAAANFIASTQLL